MRAIIITTAVFMLALWLHSSASAAENKEHTVSLSDTPAAVQKTINEKAAGAKIVRVEQEREHGKTVYEAVLAKDGKETGIEVAEDGTYLNSHDEKEEHKTGEKY